MPQRHLLERRQTVAASLDEVTSFFENPRNLEALTPPFLRFTIRTEGNIEMKEGALIDYSISLHGLPMSWSTRIESYQPGVDFVDVQLNGPYKYWHHHHTFRAVPGGTEIGDKVTYELPLGPLGAVAHNLFVKRQLATIFDYREKVVAERFGRVE